MGGREGGLETMREFCAMEGDPRQVIRRQMECVMVGLALFIYFTFLCQVLFFSHKRGCLLES
jgi:hypothetical protein